MEADNIFVDEIETLQTQLDLEQKINDVEADQPIMEGRFQCISFHNGLSMHTVDAVERQNTHSSFELPPGLSFNFIFKGKVDFSFAGQRYILAPQGRTACCSAILNNSHDLLSRSMSEGMHIKKVNVFVEQQWLEARCKTTSDVEMLTRIFSNKRVFSWLPNKSTLDKAKRLLELSKATSFSDKLEAEFLTVQLLSSCMETVNTCLDELDQASIVPIRKQKLSLKKQIEALLEKHSSLHEIAIALGMSERTLQRKFQATYQQTASNFLKQKRMESAKKALVIEGKSIGEAAYIAGYNHPSNFVNAFKKAFGITPSEFVRRHNCL